MSTPKDIIDRLFEEGKLPTPMQRDVSNITLPSERLEQEKNKVTPRDFLRGFVPEAIRKYVPTTEEARGIKREQELRGKIPRPKEGGREKHELLIQEAMKHPEGTEFISENKPSLFERITPDKLKEAFRPTTLQEEEFSLSKITKGIVELASDPTNLMEQPGAAGALPFARKLFNRVDRAIEKFPQARATTQQWLGALTKGVPETEAKGIREVLGRVDPERLITKDAVKRLLNRKYQAPKIKETTFGAARKPEWKESSSGSRYVMNDNMSVISIRPGFRGEGFDLYNPNGLIDHFDTIEEAEKAANNIFQSYHPPKWSGTKMPGGEDYGEIVLQLPDPEVKFNWHHNPMLDQYEMVDPSGRVLGNIGRIGANEWYIGGAVKKVFPTLEEAKTYANQVANEIFAPTNPIYAHRSHWPDVRNPFAHLRMTTRDIALTPETIAERIQGIKKIREEGYTLSEAKDIYDKTNNIKKLKARMIEELQSDWAQDIRRKGVKTDDISRLPDPVIPKPGENGWSEFNYNGKKYKVLFDTDGIPVAFRVPRDLHSESAYYESIEGLKESIKKYAAKKGVPDMPFKNTDQWVDIGLERAIEDAIDNDVDILTWTTGKQQFDLYGSELIDWRPNFVRENIPGIDDLRNKYQNIRRDLEGMLNQSDDYLQQIAETKVTNMSGTYTAELVEAAKDILKNRGMISKRAQDGFVVKGLKQYLGETQGIALQQAAIDRGLQVDKELVVKSKEQLEMLLDNILEHKEDVPKQAEKIWARMQKESKGQSLPRKEGMDYFYDEMIPRRLKEVGKKMGVKIEPIMVDVSYNDVPRSGIIFDAMGNPKAAFRGPAQKQMGIRITPELKKSALENGYPLLSTVPALGIGKKAMENKQVEQSGPKVEKKKSPFDLMFD